MVQQPQRGSVYAMTEPTVRAPRRHVRSKCWLNVEGREITGFSINLSTSGLGARVQKTVLGGQRLEAGMQLAVSLILPGDALPIQFRAEVVWTDARDRDLGGHASVSMGMRIIEVAAEAKEKLARFVEEFRYSVMIVDEDPEDLALVSEALQKDYRVIACRAGPDALEALSHEEVAVLITAQATLSGEGHQVLRQFGERHVHSQVIKLVSERRADREQLQEFIQLGKLFHYLPKPFLVSELRHIVDRAVSTYAMAVENERLSGELERANLRLQRENSYLPQRVA